MDVIQVNLDLNLYFVHPKSDSNRISSIGNSSNRGLPVQSQVTPSESVKNNNY